MLRAAIELIVTLVVIYLVRSVITILAKSFTGVGGTPGGPAGNRSAGNAHGGSHSSSPPPSELKKDPVCGTFVSTATALKKDTRGETYYFCSAECRDKFRG